MFGEHGKSTSSKFPISDMFVRKVDFLARDLGVCFGGGILWDLNGSF